MRKGEELKNSNNYTLLQRERGKWSRKKFEMPKEVLRNTWTHPDATLCKNFNQIIQSIIDPAVAISHANLFTGNWLNTFNNVPCLLEVFTQNLVYSASAPKMRIDSKPPPCQRNNSNLYIWLSTPRVIASSGTIRTEQSLLSRGGTKPYLIWWSEFVNLNWWFDFGWYFTEEIFIKFA